MHTSFPRLLSFLIVMVLISLSCSLPVSGTQEPPQSDLEATIAALETQVNMPATSAPSTEVAHSPVATETALPDPTGALLPQSRYRGFVAWNNNQFRAYDFSGASLGFQVPSGSQEWYGENEVTVLSDAIYYSVFGTNSGVFRVDAGGTSQLNYIDANEPVSISVSPDGGLIAWATNQWVNTSPASDIFIANIDGSSARLVENIPADEQENGWLVFHPVRWTSEGKLLYATGPTGIGGYLLFWGYSGLRLYDPVQNTTEMLVSDAENLGLCLSAVSDDITKIALVCGDGTRAVRVRTLSTNQEVQFPILSDQNNAGSARFSADGTWLAYVIQRMDPDNEFGQVVVVPVDGSAAPRVVYQLEGGILNVDGWVDNNTFLITRVDSQQTSSVWKLNRDGNLAEQLLSGKFIGFYP